MGAHLKTRQIAGIFAEIAVLLELKGENQFKVRAFQNAARNLKSLELSTEELIEQLKLKTIKGFGAQLSESIFTLYETGTLPAHQELKAEFPDTILDLLDVPGLGAKKIKVLYQEKNISSLDELEQACKENTLEGLKGFGKKTIQNILAGIVQLRKYRSRFRYDEAITHAQALSEYLQQSDSCTSVEITGSLRRGMETVKNIDILAVSAAPENLISHFIKYPEMKSIISQGSAKSAILLNSGIAADLNVVEPPSLPSALLHFTGSKEHNTALQALAKERRLKLNEHGLFDGESPLSLNSEEDIYRHLELAAIPPELRENLDELERAASSFRANAPLPKLVCLDDMKGIIHAHTTYSDGSAKLKEMALEVRDRGFQYFGVSDHSRTATYAGGLTIDDIKRQHAEIDKLNEELAPFRIFKGIESDILADGSLDYPDSVLETFDFIIASLHSQLTMKRPEMMKRLEAAIANPYTTILGHVSTRKLLLREPADIDIPRIIELAAEHSVAVEINANPKRLDLDWRFCRQAQQLGVAIPICPDAHSPQGIDDIRYGVVTARKGGLRPADVLTTWDLKQVETYFANKR